MKICRRPLPMFQKSVPADEKIDGFPYPMSFEDEGEIRKIKKGLTPKANISSTETGGYI